MTDKISVQRRSENMRRIRSKGMKPEMAVRKIVHALGYRYRLHKKDLPGNPDLVFNKKKKIIFVNGCFWHQHESSHCRISRIPKSNKEFWLPKLKRTKQRDKSNISLLRRLGWKILIVWECQTKNPLRVEKKIVKFLD